MATQAHFLYYRSDLSRAGESICAHDGKHQNAEHKNGVERFTARLRIEHRQQLPCPS